MIDMANASIRFSFDATGVQKVREDLARVAKEARAALFRIALAHVKKREQRAYLNMLRSTRRTRKVTVRRWELAKLRVKVCKMRVESPTTEVRIVSRNIRKGDPIAMIETIFARGMIAPSNADRRTILLGHRALVTEIDECPIEILQASDLG